LILVTTIISGRPKPELCFFSGRLRLTFLFKERYGDSLVGRGSNTLPSNWEPTLYHRAIAAQSKYCTMKLSFTLEVYDENSNASYENPPRKQSFCQRLTKPVARRPTCPGPYKFKAHCLNDVSSDVSSCKVRGRSWTWVARSLESRKTCLGQQ